MGSFENLTLWDKHAVLGNKSLTKVGDGFEAALRKGGLKAISAKRSEAA
jgi:hypothetical protein